MWKDCLGRDIHVGDIIYYPVSSGGEQQVRWGKVLEKFEKHPHNVVGYLKNCPCIKVKAEQNTKFVILVCHQNNMMVNLSSQPITDLNQIKRK